MIFITWNFIGKVLQVHSEGFDRGFESAFEPAIEKLMKQLAPRGKSRLARKGVSQRSINFLDHALAEVDLLLYGSVVAFMPRH
jgi:hypothetical protein